ARLIVPHFALVHSLDSIKLAGKVDRLAVDAGKIQDVLLECNVSGEASKSGWHIRDWQNNTARRESLWNAIQSMLKMPGLRFRGLMTMAPIVPDPEMTRPIFADLRQLQTALREDFPQVDWSELSMGMSGDFQVAISEGATIVRIGRAIFGARRTRLGSL
ncbi:YggS family pyridoxal phosphate-dependent enzyme, partial [Chloroflexota bacterium]